MAAPLESSANGRLRCYVYKPLQFQAFFPEHDTPPLVGILASLSVEKSVPAYAEKQGFPVLAVGDELMKIRNRLGI